MTDAALSALAKPWAATMIATTLSVAVLALPQVWASSTYVRVVLSLDMFG